METITDLRYAKLILNKICIENNIDKENVFIDKKFKYIETVNTNIKDADFCSTDYRGFTFKVQYISGCFNPFICSMGKTINLKK